MGASTKGAKVSPAEKGREAERRGSGPLPERVLLVTCHTSARSCWRSGRVFLLVYYVLINLWYFRILGRIKKKPHTY